MDLAAEDRVENLYSRELGTVIEVNCYWGWFIVQWDSGVLKKYVFRKGQQTVRKINEFHL